MVDDCMTVTRINSPRSLASNVPSDWTCGSPKTGVVFVLPFVHGGVLGGATRSFRVREENDAKVKRFTQTQLFLEKLFSGKQSVDSSKPSDIGLD
jgi:hypothetical protein